MLIKNKLSLIIMIIMLIGVITSTGSVNAGDPDPFVEESYKKIITQILDLKVDGSINPVLVNVTADFDYIQKAIFVLVWNENSVNYSEFGTGGRLTNGTSLYYDGEKYFNGIVCISCFAYLAFDMDIYVDNKNPVGNHLMARIRYDAAVPNHGLKMGYDHAYQVKIQDDLTVICESFALIVIGYKTMDIAVDFDRDFLEEVMIIDNPIKLFLVPLIFPLALIFTQQPVYVVLGVGILLVELVMAIKIVYWRKNN